MVSSAAYLALFLSAFGAATILPLQSEALLVGLLALERDSVWALLTVASAGNVLGSVVNWVLGRYLEQWRDKAWFPVGPDKLARAQGVYHRFGYWTLLLSWVPIIGDPLTVVAGFMREPLWRFILVVTLAKTGRYLVLAGATLGMLG